MSEYLLLVLKLCVVAAIIAKAFLLPLGLGMGLRLLIPRIAEALSDRLIRVFGIVLTLTGVILLATHMEVFLQMQRGGMLALTALMLIALAIGHALGGPDADDRTALALACSTRHIGIAVLVASAFPGMRTIVMIAAYTVASAGVSIPYLVWRRRKAGG